MATLSEARSVKSLNTGPGRKRFTFKTLAQQFEEIDIDVYRSLDTVKAEPSEGSTFFRDCLIEWRELNTAEDFISFYQEIFPLVQTLPQIILQKKIILSKLLSRLQMKSRLSLEPILRLIAALSRDLLEDFLPFLQEIVNSLINLLESGADREPEIIKQIFTSWSYAMMFLQKYLIKDVVHVLKATAELRYYPHGDVQRFMAKSISFLFRKAPVEQAIKGIGEIMNEVIKEPLATRNGATELLLHVIKGSSTLHSRAQEVLRILLDKSLFSIGDHLLRGSESIVEVLISTFGRLSNDLGPVELRVLWNCLFGEIIESITNGYLVHLSQLLSLLVCIVQNGFMKKITDYQPIFELARLMLQTYVTSDSREAEEPAKEVVNKFFQLLLVIVDSIKDDVSALSEFSCQCVPLFSLRDTSLATFLKDLVLRDSEILKAFRINIVSALNDLVGISEEESIYLLLRFIENLRMPTSSFLDGIPEERLSNICRSVRGIIKRNLSSLRCEDNELALLWGTIKCYPYVVKDQEDRLLLSFINALDKPPMVNSALDEPLMVNSGFDENACQSLIGATLGSYKEMICCNGKIENKESAISKFLYFAKKYHSCSRILVPIADILDSLLRSELPVDPCYRRYHLELQASKVAEALHVYAENLCHFDPLLRQSTLRILCHYEPLTLGSKRQTDNKKDGNVAFQACNVDDQVLELLLSVEAVDLPSTSRKGEHLISRIQTTVSSKRINENYVLALLYGMIGVFHKKFSKFWDPAMECLTLLISRHFQMVWERYVQYVVHCQSMFLTSHDDSGTCGSDTINMSSDLVQCFKSSIGPQSGSMPWARVFFLLIKSLQKVPALAESHSQQLVPLFLKFLGYPVDGSMSVELYKIQHSRCKEWKEVVRN